jgi:hypothetical protein
MAQDAKLTLNGKEYAGIKIAEGKYDFKDANLILLPLDTLKKIIAKLKFLKVVVHEDSIKLAAKDRIITAYDSFENGADKLVENQRLMIKTADSLYTGYKGLYRDLKKLCRINSFSVTPGVGLMNISDISPSVNLVFNVGFEYNKINLNALAGKKFQGLTVGYRFGF